MPVDGAEPKADLQIQPRMVALLGPASFADETRFDFIEQLPELRAVMPVAAPDQEHQVAMLYQLVGAHAAAYKPAPTTFPALAIQVMDNTFDRRAGFDKIATLVLQDPAVTGAVLRVCNSALYHRGGASVVNVKTAVAQLGLDEVRRLASGVASQSLYDIEVVSEFQLFRKRWSELFHRSLTVAFSAGWLAAKMKVRQPERDFLGGMFHDIGKTIALRSLSALMLAGKVPFQPSDPAIDEVLEKLHVEIGVRLHEAWGLPEDLATICRLHHERRPPPGDHLRDLHIVRLCGALDELHRVGSFGEESAECVRASLRELALSFTQYRLLTARVVSFAERVSALFGLGGSEPEQSQAEQSVAWG